MLGTTIDGRIVIGNWQIAHISVSERFFAYADAYLQAAIGVCIAMRDHEARKNWPNAAVSLMLAAHAVELFLKGAILKRSPEADIDTHTIATLAERYHALFPSAEFAFDVPFKTEYEGFTAEEAAALAKKEPVPSIMYRYPVDKTLSEWHGINGLEAASFLGTLASLNEVFSVLCPRINGA